MEEQENMHHRSNSEVWAARIMRALAMTGLVSVLALVAWIVVQGVRYVPNVGEGVTAAVSSFVSVFRKAPEESVRFDLSTRSFEAFEEATISWEYTGPSLEPVAELRYGCDSSVTLRVYSEGAWKEPTCDEWTVVGTSSTRILPLSQVRRYADLELFVRVGVVSDNTLITVLNTTPDTSDSGTSTASVATTSSNTDTTSQGLPAERTTVTQVPREVTVPVTQPVRSLEPADLAINIEETGVYIDVAKKRTFFPVSPIPSDKRAGVVFTVTNTGETTSALWSFTLYVPTADDPSYKYTSPLQEPLKPGMQVEFTLGFDELPDKGKGTIRAELITLDTSDPAGNNKDAVSVTFK